MGITWDGSNVVSLDNNTDKHYLHSGFSSSISDSYTLTYSEPEGISWDLSNVLCVDDDPGAEKHYKHSGFSSSISDSYSVSAAGGEAGITWDGRYADVIAARADALASSTASGTVVLGREVWYLRTTAGSACGPGDRESLSETQGSSNSTKALDGTGDTWNVSEERTILAGNWTLYFDVECPDAGGPQNKINVLVERRNSSCIVQGSAIINEDVDITKGATQEYSTTPTDPGEIAFSSGDLITVILTDANGNQAKTVYYNGSGSSYDSRLVHPLVTAGADVLGTATSNAVTSSSSSAGRIRKGNSLAKAVGAAIVAGGLIFSGAARADGIAASSSAGGLSVQGATNSHAVSASSSAAVLDKFAGATFHGISTSISAGERLRGGTARLDGLATSTASGTVIGGVFGNARGDSLSSSISSGVYDHLATARADGVSSAVVDGEIDRAGTVRADALSSSSADSLRDRAATLVSNGLSTAQASALVTRTASSRGDALSSSISAGAFIRSGALRADGVSGAEVWPGFSRGPQAHKLTAYQRQALRAELSARPPLAAMLSQAAYPTASEIVEAQRGPMGFLRRRVTAQQQSKSLEVLERMQLPVQSQWAKLIGAQQVVQMRLAHQHLMPRLTGLSLQELMASARVLLRLVLIVWHRADLMASAAHKPTEFLQEPQPLDPMR
jgi:hypothetical protein